MRPPRRTAAFTRLSVMMLACTGPLPALSQSVSAASRAPLADGLALPAPDLPAGLDRSLVDLAPRRGVPVASSGRAADPGAILDTYAPLRPSTAPGQAAIASRPATKADEIAPTKAAVPGVAALAPTAEGSDTTGSLPASAPSVASAPPIRRGADDVPVLPEPGTPPMPAAGPTPAVPAAAAPAPAALAPVDAPAAAFDPAALRKALDAFVGVEPAPVAGRIDATELARFKDRQAISAFYAARADAPLWIEDGRFGPRAREALARIDHAAEDGLDLKAFPVSVPNASADPAELATAELSLTRAAVAYGWQATGGRVDPARLAPLIGAKPDVADAARVLAALAAASDPGAALRAFNPSQPGYAALRDKLAELRGSSDMAARARIPYGPILKLGMRDKRVPLIRARFGLDMSSSGSGDASDLVYDTKVAAAVANFQHAHHLPASGILTIRTVGILSGGADPRRLETEIVANMEAWRWLPRDMGETHLDVNIPDYSLDLVHGDEVIHHARVVVGQPDKPTPVFSQTMQFIIVNPYWNVPLSIVKKEMMPKLAADPNYFADHGYETVERGGVTYVRQPPGDSNALGRIKFMFPNKYAVYLHDTNARALFGKEKRALSHGCVRVEAPFKLAEAVLGRSHGWSEARIKKMIGGEERTIMLPAPLPIHIVYFTAFVDRSGELKLRDDIYGYTGKLEAALGLDG
ncbi:MAG TPA: L,D-transpeptidase family protein [Lichenihabitans sp.]|jgi:murein L,D-transpeptidase YcbB/YkuD|nr:L,D-transpeptidase family protein [Lichenihabitans sp.]